MLLTLACSPHTAQDTGASGKDEAQSAVRIGVDEPGPTPWTTLTGTLQLDVGFREPQVGDRDCALVWTAQDAVATDRCSDCDFAFDVVWTLDLDESTPGEHCAPRQQDWPMSLGVVLGSVDPIFVGTLGGPVYPLRPAASLIEADGGWAFSSGELDVPNPEGGFDTTLLQGMFSVE